MLHPILFRLRPGDKSPQVHATLYPCKRGATVEPSENRDAGTGADLPAGRENDPEQPSAPDAQNRAHPSEVLMAITGNFTIRFVD
jgi:hypothetical protein